MTEHPPLYQIGEGHVSRCHLAQEPERRLAVQAARGDAWDGRRDSVAGGIARPARA